MGSGRRSSSGGAAVSSRTTPERLGEGLRLLGQGGADAIPTALDVLPLGEPLQHGLALSAVQQGLQCGSTMVMKLRLSWDDTLSLNPTSIPRGWLEAGQRLVSPDPRMP